MTWLLKPLVVMGHLLGGMLTFALLAWTAWRSTDAPIHLADARMLRRLVWVALGLLAVQLALGGWTSSNVRAASCAVPTDPSIALHEPLEYGVSRECSAVNAGAHTECEGPYR